MRILFAILLPLAACASIWPDGFGAFHRTSAAPAGVSQQALWDEYGLQQAERAVYESGGTKFTATAYRFQDSTGAMAAFQWQRPAGARSSSLSQLSVETPDSVILTQGNYLFVFSGHKPSGAEMTPLVAVVPKLENSPLPPLTEYLPAAGRVLNSERYVVGPASLEQFAREIPPSIAAFHYGAEAQLATFRTASGEMNLAIFSYPTPQIARERLVDFQRISGAMAKRAGPLVAVVLRPANADDAERLLALVRYEPSVTMSERVPTKRDNIGDLVINAFELIGILLLFCLVAGIAVGGARTILRRAGPHGEAEAMITLHLSDR